MGSKRAFDKTLAWRIFIDEENFESMKGLNHETVLGVIRAFLKAVKENLQSGVNIVCPEFGTFRVKHPNSKSRRCRDIATGEITLHKIKSKVVLKAYFEIEEEQNVKGEEVYSGGGILSDGDRSRDSEGSDSGGEEESS